MAYVKMKRAKAEERFGICNNDFLTDFYYSNISEWQTFH